MTVSNADRNTDESKRKIDWTHQGAVPILIGMKTDCFAAVAVFGAMALLTAGCAAQAQLTLAREGKSDYTIVVAGDASPADRHGAGELQAFLEQICGARLPIAEEPVAGPMVLVGRSGALDALSLDIDFDALGDEGLVIRTVGPHLVLAGGARCTRSTSFWTGTWAVAGSPPVSTVPRSAASRAGRRSNWPPSTTAGFRCCPPRG